MKGKLALVTAQPQSQRLPMTDEEEERADQQALLFAIEEIRDARAAALKVIEADLQARRVASVKTLLAAEEEYLDAANEVVAARANLTAAEAAKREAAKPRGLLRFFRIDTASCAYAQKVLQQLEVMP
jgi:hypothetical protein